MTRMFSHSILLFVFTIVFSPIVSSKSCRDTSPDSRFAQKARIQLDFISISVLSFVSGSSPGRRPSRGKGNRELRLQRTIRKAKLSNLSLVTPNTWVRPAPIRPPRTLPPLEMDIRVAKRVASIPCGHILAANTRTGMKDALCYPLADYVNCCRKLACQNSKENTHVSSPRLSDKQPHQMAVWM